MFFGISSATFNSKPVHSDSHNQNAPMELVARNYGTAVSFSTKDGLELSKVENLYTHDSLSPATPAFSLTLADGSVELSTSFKIIKPMVLSEQKGQRSALELALRSTSEVQTVVLENDTKTLLATWELVYQKTTNYMREVLTIKAENGPVNVASIQFAGWDAGSSIVQGTVPGSPISDRFFFFGVEHPMSVSSIVDGKVSAEMDRKLPIDAGESVTYSFVIGATPAGQLRRGFQNYIQNQRAAPYHTFLHYNSWYDFPLDVPYNANECVDRIHKFGEELVKKRHVKMSSFLFDDGWDNYKTTWEFNSGFPDQFLPLKKEANKYGAGPGVWLSPWGGYGDPHTQRIATGKLNGMEEDADGLSLSGAKYYKVFHDRTMDFVTTQGINQFKFDGTGSPDVKYPGSKFDSNFDAAISLIKDLRKASPSLFINLTTGTWPSPFWLQFADSTWRGGYDHNFAGVGTKRQQWMTYRDGDTYEGVVQKGPLYPINSLMLHGIIYANYAHDLMTDPGDDFRADVRTYFATGTQLQELYITPDKLTNANWNDLAESAKWAANNASILEDVKWIGGDPLKLEVYGHAAWSLKKSIISLRNPSDKPQTFSADIADLLELPAGSPQNYMIVASYKDETGFPIAAVAGQQTTFELKPFETLVVELVPLK